MTAYKFIKDTDGEVQTYQGKTVTTGDVVDDFNDHFQGKCATSDDWEAITEKPVAKKKAATGD